MHKQDMAMWLRRHLNLDDRSAGTLGLAPHHEAAPMALDGDSCLVHDVSAHGVQNSHLPAPEEHLHTPAGQPSGWRNLGLLPQAENNSTCCQGRNGLINIIGGLETHVVICSFTLGCFRMTPSSVDFPFLSDVWIHMAALVGCG